MEVDANLRLFSDEPMIRLHPLSSADRTRVGHFPRHNLPPGQSQHPNYQHQEGQQRHYCITMIFKKVHSFLRLFGGPSRGFMVRYKTMNTSHQSVSLVTSIKVTKVSVPLPVFQSWGCRTKLVGWFIEKKAA
jgi:hypothetical protein